MLTLFQRFSSHNIFPLPFASCILQQEDLFLMVRLTGWGPKIMAGCVHNINLLNNRDLPVIR